MTQAFWIPQLQPASEVYIYCFQTQERCRKRVREPGIPRSSQQDFFREAGCSRQVDDSCQKDYDSDTAIGSVFFFRDVET